MRENNRRRIDQVQDEAFLTNLEALSDNEVRERRVLCDELDIEFSYYRRMLHGRMDLIAFQMRKLAGEEQESLIDALPRILAEGAYASTPGLSTRPVPVEVPDIPRHGHRIIDKALDGDFIVRLPTLEIDDLTETQQFLQEVEVEISRQRRVAHDALDALQAELTRRYSDGAIDPDELLASG